mmetsp:Transcript_89965/g.259301  ORF Transcript_89965/g.259301 Transcript_89965/m.259301 type:complete len:260 (+) Transcript_89965:146-925(+)
MANASAFEGCVPDWSIEGYPCTHGYKFFLPGSSFTIPSPGSVWTMVGCFYSAMPFFCTLAAILLLLRRRKPREMCWLLCSTSTTAACNLMKRWFREQRPASCLTTCGMPSGHSAFALSFLVFVLVWDSLSRVPQIESGHNCSGRHARKVALACVMLPIPWSRVVLGDHSMRQVFGGSIIGVLGAALWLLIFGPCCEGFLNRLLRRSRSQMPSRGAATGGVGSVGGVGGGREPVLDRSLLAPGFELSLPKADVGCDSSQV